MGAFLVNFHAKTPDAGAVRRILASEAERGWIGPPVNGWVSFYDEQADSQDSDRIEDLCARVSTAAQSPVIAFLVHDSDVVCYWLFDRGRKQDEYNSCPDYFGDIDEMLEPGDSAEEFLERVRGNPEALLAVCPAGTDRATLERTLRVQPGQFTFAEEHLGQLSQLIGIDPERTSMAYRDIGLEVDPDEMDLEFVGTGTRPEPGEDSSRPRISIAANQTETGEGPSLPLGVALGNALLSGGLLQFARDANQKLAMALMSRNAQAIDEAIAAGADLNHQNGTPLATAVSIGPGDLVEALIERGASPARSAMALTIAVQRGDEPIVRLLLAHGADANRLDPQGLPVLHHAFRSRNVPVVEALLAAGADPTMKNAFGDTAAGFLEKFIRQAEAVQGMAAGGADLLASLRRMLDLVKSAASQSDDSAG